MSSKVYIIGDSLLKGLPEEGKRYKTLCYRGLRTERLQGKIIRGVFDGELDGNSSAVIFVGTNNLKSESSKTIASDLLNLASLLRSRYRGIAIKLCTLLPRTDKVWLNDKCKLTNKALKKLCVENKVELIETHKAFLKAKQIKVHLLGEDGLHLTHSGSLALQRSILDKV